MELRRQSIIKGVDMDLARIVEADYVSIPLDATELDAAVASARTETEVAELLSKLEVADAAKRQRNLSLKKPHSFATAYAPSRIRICPVCLAGKRRRHKPQRINAGLRICRCRLVKLGHFRG